MIIIPKMYIRSRKVVSLERTSSPIYDEDPIVMARKMKQEGAEAVYIVDLGIANVGEGENLPIIKRIHDELGLKIFAGDNFKSVNAISTYIGAGVETVVMEGAAYQQPALVSEACGRFPGRIAVSIFVRSGRVTIPGWSVAANKTAIDYAEQFGKAGVDLFFYSDVGDSGFLEKESLNNLLLFCKKVRMGVICTSEVRDSSDIEKLVILGAPGLDGMVLAHALYEGRVDLRAVVNLASDLSIAPSNEPTMQEE